jgi:hypothetical protein
MSLLLQQAMKDMYFEVVPLIAHACLTRVSDIPTASLWELPDIQQQACNKNQGTCG